MPLDENLPTFFLAKPNKDTIQHPTFFLSRGGPEPEPAYILRHADRETSKNCYAVALFDAFNQDVLYGEVNLQPAWTLPTLSQEEIRKHGGVPPPPEPLLPREFTVQLYNPDQQINVVHKQGALLASEHWDFSMPQTTFRMPSASMLDRSRNDPGFASTTPRITFTWKRENKFGRDLTCYMTGKTTTVVGKKGRKEADITIALFKSLKEITIYEPNLYRVEMEDPKGLEVVLLLMAAVIREVYFGNIRQAFNISEADRKANANTGLANDLVNDPPPNQSSPSLAPVSSMSPKLSSAAASALYAQPNAHTTPPSKSRYSRPPPTDPRTQWEIDNETQMLLAQVQAEEREMRRREAIRRRSDEEEARRLGRVLEEEKQARRRKQSDIEQETERLRRIYGDQNFNANLPGPPPNLPGPPPFPPPSHNYAPPAPQQPMYSPAGPFYLHGALQQQQFPPPLPERPSTGVYVHQNRYGYGARWANTRSSTNLRSGPGLSRKLSSVW